MANALVLPEQPYTIECDTDDEREWHRVRRTGLGASEMGGVLGIASRRSSPLKIYCEKTGALEPEDLSDVEAFDWGHTMEPVIAAKYAQRTGRPVDSGRGHRFQVLRSTQYPWATCSLDYWTADNDGGPRRPLEIKNVSGFLAEDWVDGPPEYYRAQLNAQMLITGATRATSACCLGGNRLIWCDVDRDETMIRRIIYHGERLWQRILERTPPDPDDSEATREVLKRLFPTDDGSSVVLTMAVAEKVDEWRAIKAEIAKLSKRCDAIENELKATLGNARDGFLPTGDRISYATQERREYTVKASTIRVLRYHPSKGM